MINEKGINNEKKKPEDIIKEVEQQQKSLENLEERKCMVQFDFVGENDDELTIKVSPVATRFHSFIHSFLFVVFGI